MTDICLAKCYTLSVPLICVWPSVHIISDFNIGQRVYQVSNFNMYQPSVHRISDFYTGQIVYVYVVKDLKKYHSSMHRIIDFNIG